MNKLYGELFRDVRESYRKIWGLNKYENSDVLSIVLQLSRDIAGGRLI